MSPYLESCCLRLSANVSYQNAAADLSYLTGIEVSRSAQQRLVHRQDFSQPEVAQAVKELSLDGGNIRVRTPQGEPCRWRGYKAICLHEREAVAAAFGESTGVIEWVNRQPLAPVVTCLGDGHEGIWNVIAQLAPQCQRQEVLDWFHLMENLHKVGGSIKRMNDPAASGRGIKQPFLYQILTPQGAGNLPSTRLNQAEALLWRGEVSEAQACFWAYAPGKLITFMII